jgi:hypothetical protein
MGDRVFEVHAAVDSLGDQGLGISGEDGEDEWADPRRSRQARYARLQFGWRLFQRSEVAFSLSTLSQHTQYLGRGLLFDQRHDWTPTMDPNNW